MFGSDRETHAQHRRDRDDLAAEHAHWPIPATCGGCGAKISLILWPQITKLEDGDYHRCVTTLAGERRLVAIDAAFRRHDAETKLRQRAAIR